ncbi:MAG: HepT-like ribonuclease domain-containing protein [Pseudomonadota bacterium]
MPTEQPHLRFNDIVQNIDLIESYLAELGDRPFAQVPLVRDAVERCLARISEAAVKLGPSAEELAPSIAWQNIRSFGNHLRHAYDQIDSGIVLDTIEVELPKLKESCIEAIRQLKNNCA